MINLLALFCLSLNVLANNEDLSIKTKLGVLKGSYGETWKGRQFKSFTRIPYAKPPIGELRFEKPLPADPWEGTLDATLPNPMCIQVDAFLKNYNPIGQEDCLYLNVYVPKEPKVQSSLPVMLFIHGGGFMSGSTYFYTPDYLLDKDIILITINYRLGAFGFISTGDEIVPGNMGLKDQSFAIKWTKQNIKDFGGDPDRITIFGESAGAASTHYHLLSPLSRDLFSAAAFSSGSSLSSWALSTKGETLENTKKLAKTLKCPTDNSKKMVQCLKKLDHNKIVELHEIYLEWAFTPIINFKPVIEPKLEGAFITEDPFDIIKSGNAANVPILTGLTQEDGAFPASILYNNSKHIEELETEFDRLMPTVMLYKNTAPNVDYVTKQIRKFYFSGIKIDENSKGTVVNMFTDAWFLQAEDAAVQLHHKYNTKPIYYFLFGYRGSMTITDFMTTDRTYDYGVTHSDDLFYLFKYFRMVKDFQTNEIDDKMVDLMVTFYTNFAITGNPTPQIDEEVTTKWEPVQSNKMEYYAIKSPSDLSMKEDLFKERRDFWRNLPMDSRRIKIREEL